MKQSIINSLIFGTCMLLYFLARILFGNEVYTTKYLLTSIAVGVISAILFYFAMTYFNPFKKKED